MLYEFFKFCGLLKRISIEVENVIPGTVLRLLPQSSIS